LSAGSQPGGDLCPPDRDLDGFDETRDCEDSDPLVNAGAPDIRCNGRDENCSGTDECDADRDGHEAETPVPVSHAILTHWSSGDCNDRDPAVYVGAPEVACDGVDEDCDGEDCCENDKDGDGVPCRLDCDDRDKRVYPSAPIPPGCWNRISTAMGSRMQFAHYTDQTRTNYMRHVQVT
jgi:hypothetical protein